MNLFLKVGGLYKCTDTKKLFYSLFTIILIRLSDGTMNSVEIDGPLWGTGSS